MIMNRYIAGADHEGLRLDCFLAQISDGQMTRSSAQRMIADGLVTAGSKLLKKNYIVSYGDEVTVQLQESAETEATPQDIPLEVVYEDSDIIVVNKPRGMVVHPAPGHPDQTLVNALLYHCKGSLSGVGGEMRPGIVHRIDKDTSGMLISAKNDMAHRALSEQLENHTLSRIYEAVVCGSFKQDSGTVDAPLGRHPRDRKRMGVVASGKRAVTHFEVIGRYNGYTHIRCRLETGRTHQIRVHMAHIGHPLLGDLVYGRKKPEKGISGQCLHARELSFIHPRSGEEMTLTTDLPQYFKDVFSKLGTENL